MLKRISCLMLAFVLFASACMTNGFGVWAANGETNVEINKLYSGHNENIITFELSASDYGSETKGMNEKHTEYNYWTNIQVYTSETEHCSLSEAYTDQKYYAMWGRSNTVSIQLKAEIYSKATKIVIPAGTIFPSKAYTNDGSSEKGGYVTTKEMIYERPSATISSETNWVKKEKPQNVNTEVTKIDIANKAVRFYLSVNDYGTTDPNNGTATSFTEYNYWDKVVIYTSATESKTLKQAYANKADSGNTTFYNLWTAYGTYAVSIDQKSLDSAIKVVIPSGTEFPSYEYTTGKVSAKKSFVTTEDIAFVKTNGVWVKTQIGGSGIEQLTSTPANGETVNLLEGGIYNFATNYEKGSSEQYCTKGDCYAPKGVTFSWSQLKGVTEYTVEISTSDSMLYPMTYTSSTNSVVVDNLQAGKTYFYRIKINDGNGVQTSSVFMFKTAQLPRTILIDGVSNTRDLGGYLTADGKYRVRQGMVYRGANLEGITEKGKTEFLQKYGIKTDLDVRGDKKRSPLGSSVNYVSAAGPQYVQIGDQQYREYLATEIRTFADSANYPIYFHCQIGRDRTGTLAFLLNALLGVSEQDIYMDYELSMFSQAGWADNTAVSELVNKHFADLVKYIKDYGNGTLQENAEEFVKNELGITTSEIQSIRALMLEEADGASTYDTEVTKIQVRAGKLIVFPRTMDYASVAHTTRLNGKLTDYNILDSIVLYKSETEKATLKDVVGDNVWYNVWDTDNSIAFDLKSGWDGTSITKVEFLAGGYLPAYGYTNGTDTIKTAFVIRENTTFTTKSSASVNTDWTLSDTSAPEKSQVSKVQSGHNGNIVTIYLTNADYTGLLNGSVGEKHTTYNYLDKIQVYTSETDYVTLKEAYNAKGQKYYNMWGEANTLSLEWKSEIFEKAVRIVIPEGTVFPSSQYTLENTDRKAGYIVKEKQIFEKTAEGSFWKVVDISQPENTIVTKLLSGHNASIMTFYLTNTDYENNAKVGSNHTDYNYLDKIRLYTDDTTYKTLREVYKQDGQILYNMWTRTHTFSIELDTEYYKKVTKVEIPKDTVFPSYVHTNMNEAYKFGFVTNKDNTFGKPKNAAEGDGGYEWISLNPAINRDTTVTNIQVRDKSGKLFLFLDHHDYLSVAGNTKIGSQLSIGNILQKIVIYRADGAIKTLEELYTGEGYYNLWGEQGCIALDLADGWDGKNIVKVVVLADCEFPCYAYASGSMYDKTFYKTKYETVFSATSMPECDEAYDNISYEQSIVIPSQPVDTNVMGAVVLGAEGDMRLILTLSEHDYHDASDSEACANRFKDYNTLSHIKLCLGNTVVSLSDAINEEEVYFNIWGRTGTVSYGLKSQYHTKSFDKVIIQSGCEFPSVSYTQTDTLTKIAYTVTEEQSIALAQEKYTVTYYDTNHKVLYTDQVACGEKLVLRKAPERAGYEASWSGMVYTLMPAEDISYILVYEEYTAIADVDEKEEDETSDEKESPKTGDVLRVAAYIVTMFSMMAGALIAWILGEKKTKNNEREE